MHKAFVDLSFKVLHPFSIEINIFLLVNAKLGRLKKVNGINFVLFLACNGSAGFGTFLQAPALASQRLEAFASYTPIRRRKLPIQRHSLYVGHLPRDIQLLSSVLDNPLLISKW